MRERPEKHGFRGVAGIAVLGVGHHANYFVGAKIFLIVTTKVLADGVLADFDDLAKDVRAEDFAPGLRRAGGEPACT